MYTVYTYTFMVLANTTRTCAGVPGARRSGAFNPLSTLCRTHQAGRHNLEGVGEGHPLNNAKLDNSGWQTRPGRSG